MTSGKHHKLIPVLALMIGLSMIYSCKDNEPKKLTIATAANMQFAMEDLTEAFTQQTGIACQSIVSSSGKLTAQIKEGAPFDIFVAANMMYPEELFIKGFTMDKPKIYAYGSLVLWSMQDTIPPSLSMLTNDNVRHIALANPKTAPYGIAALEVLKNSGLYTKIEKKLVYGESIAQTNQFVISGAAEIGFTAKAVVLSPEMKDKGRWVEIDASLYPKISQGVVRIKQSVAKNALSEHFYNFLFSKEAKEIEQRFGYSNATETVHSGPSQ